MPDSEKVTTGFIQQLYIQNEKSKRQIVFNFIKCFLLSWSSFEKTSIVNWLLFHNQKSKMVIFAPVDYCKAHPWTLRGSSCKRIICLPLTADTQKTVLSFSWKRNDKWKPGALSFASETFCPKLLSKTEAK